MEKGLTIWLTGLPCSGKSTIAKSLRNKIVSQSYFLSKKFFGNENRNSKVGNVIVLDADTNLRKGLCSDLGFSREDRDENVRRVAEVAKLMNQAGLCVICALISPYEDGRFLARAIHEVDNLLFVQVEIDAPLDICIKRDVKGMYEKARLGQIKNFTGVDDPFEEPYMSSDLVVNTTLPLQDCVDKIINEFFEIKKVKE